MHCAVKRSVKHIVMDSSACGLDLGQWMLDSQYQSHFHCRLLSSLQLNTTMLSYRARKTQYPAFLVCHRSQLHWINRFEWRHTNCQSHDVFCQRNTKSQSNGRTVSSRRNDISKLDVSFFLSFLRWYYSSLYYVLTKQSFFQLHLIIPRQMQLQRYTYQMLPSS